MPERNLPAPRIAGLSSARRLPRVAKLRLGLKVPGNRGDYPKDVDYFVSREEDFQRPELFRGFRKIYGEKPSQLDILFPVEDETTFFPQEFKKYGAGGLRCRGNGIAYSRTNKETGAVSEGDCPSPDDCEHARGKGDRIECKAVGNLFVLLPLVTWSGVFQIDTGSKHGIIGINSAIDYFRTFNAGRIAGIPLHLRRVEREIQYGGRKSTHAILELAFVEDPKKRERIIERAATVRGMISVFEDGPSPKEIEGDLYPKDTRRKALATGATDAAPPPAQPPPTEPPADEPPREPPTDVEPDRLCANCDAVLPVDGGILFRGMEFCGEKCLGAEKARLARISTEEEIAEDEAPAPTLPPPDGAPVPGKKIGKLF